MPAWIASLASAAVVQTIIKVLKVIGKWLWDYTKSWILSIWDNKWVITLAALCGGLFLYFYGMLNGWFGFPAILNTAVHGIFHLGNLAWVITNWKSRPSGGNSANNSGPQVSVS